MSSSGDLPPPASTPEPSLWYPPDSSRFIKSARFLNVLDDAHNVMSPVKINVWAANAAVVGTAAATVLGWLSGHLTGIESVWGGTMAWLTHAHTVHHFDKRERNKSAARLKGVGQ